MRDEALILGICGGLAWWQELYFLGLVAVTLALFFVVLTFQGYDDG